MKYFPSFNYLRKAFLHYPDKMLIERFSLALVIVNYYTEILHVIFKIHVAIF